MRAHGSCFPSIFRALLDRLGGVHQLFMGSKGRALKKRLFRSVFLIEVYNDFAHSVGGFVRVGDGLAYQTEGVRGDP